MCRYGTAVYGIGYTANENGCFDGNGSFLIFDNALFTLHGDAKNDSNVEQTSLFCIFVYDVFFFHIESIYAMNTFAPSLNVLI